LFQYFEAEITSHNLVTMGHSHRGSKAQSKIKRLKVKGPDDPPRVLLYIVAVTKEKRKLCVRCPNSITIMTIVSDIPH